MDIDELLKMVNIIRENEKAIDEAKKHRNAIDKDSDIDNSLDKQIRKALLELSGFGLTEKQLKPFRELAGLGNYGNFDSPLSKIEQLRENLLQLAEPTLSPTKSLQKMMNEIVDQQSRDRQKLYGSFVSSINVPYIELLLPKIENPFEQFLNQQKNHLEKFNVSALFSISTRSFFEPNKQLVSALGGLHKPNPIIEEIARFQRRYAEPEEEQSPVLESVHGLVNSYFVQLSNEFESGLTENSSDSLQKLDHLIQNKLNDPRQTAFSKREIITIIICLLTLLATLYQAYLARTSGIEQNQQNEKINDVFKRIIQYSESELDQNAELQLSTFYFVERPTYLKTRPSAKSNRIYQIVQETKVRLLVRKHKWVFVEGLDSINAIPVRGWVEKKYLKRIEK